MNDDVEDHRKVKFRITKKEVGRVEKAVDLTWYSEHLDSKLR